MLSRTCICIMLSLPLFSAAQSYKKIHRKAVVTDTHNDVLTTVTMHGMSIAGEQRR